MGIDVNFSNIWDFLGYRKKQEDERQPPAPTLFGKAKQILEALRPLLRPEDVQRLFKVARIGSRKLSGSGGDVVSGGKEGAVEIVFNENALGKHHPIVWAALLVRETAVTDQLLMGVPGSKLSPTRGASRAISFLNSLNDRISPSFLEKEIIKEAKKIVKRPPSRS